MADGSLINLVLVLIHRLPRELKLALFFLNFAVFVVLASMPSLLNDEVRLFVVTSLPCCLFLSENLRLLDCVGHHLLLLESFPDIVSIQAKIALLREFEQYL
jgi:hypothetical protein